MVKKKQIIIEKKQSKPGSKAKILAEDKARKEKEKKGKKGYEPPPIKRSPGKHSLLQRAERRAMVAMLDRRGFSQWDIKLELRKHNLEVSQPQISEDLKLIRRDYVKQHREETEAAIQEKLIQYRELRKEAWQAWDLSKLDHHKRVKDISPSRKAKGDEDDGSMQQSEKRIRLIVTKEGRLPANEYLVTIIKTLEAERELLGLDEAIKLNIKSENKTTTTVHLDWDSLYVRKLTTAPDPIEARILAEEEVEVKTVLPISPSENSNGNGKHHP